MLVIVRFEFVRRMRMLVLAVFACMLVEMRLGIASVFVFVRVGMSVIVAVRVRMLVRMRDVAV